MKVQFIICAVALFVIACETKPIPPQGKPEGSSVAKVVIEKEKIEKGQPHPPEVKIKLKRDSKGIYSWELSGSDVDQILKVNEKLRKQLGGEPSR
jgi:hypothetical protein